VEPTGAEKMQLEEVRQVLDEMVKRRLEVPFSADDWQQYMTLSSRERALLGRD
jgi:hypothetical protein